MDEFYPGTVELLMTMLVTIDRNVIEEVDSVRYSVEGVDKKIVKV